MTHGCKPIRGARFGSVDVRLHIDEVSTIVDGGPSTEDSRRLPSERCPFGSW